MVDRGIAVLIALDEEHALGVAADHSVTVVTSSLPVTLRGSASDLEAIYGREVHVIADLSDIAADSGSYTVPARIEVSGYDVGAVGTYEVTVHIS